MTRGFLSDVLAKWKRFRWQGLVKVWAMFMAIALVLLVESLGVHYGATRFDITYLDRDKAIPAADAIAGEKATNLLVIDSSQEGVSDAESMLDRVLLDMKVPTVTVDLAQGDEIPTLKQYQTMVIAMPNLDPLGEHVLQIMQWVKKGGGVMFAMTPERTGYLDVIGPQIGIESSAYKYVVTEGITPSKDFMLGGGQTYMFSDPFKSSLSVALNDRAQVEAVSSNGRTPLVWRSSVESGTAVMCNIGIYVKMVRGFYASAFSLLSSAMAYPVINSAAFYLDDFPSPVPVPSGNGKYIKRDYNMSISEFYSQVWWPDLVRLAERYGIRFTGVMIENYGDDTKNDPVRQTDNTQFEYYGGLLLRQNGEIGYHGYNHQPLVLPNTDYGNEYPYVQWPNRKAIVDSLNELIAFQKAVLPAATSSVYVPPSNILSSEGRKIIGEDVPQIRAIASMAFPPDSSLEYVQEFGVAADGVVEAPRIVSGSMVNNSYMRLAAVSELNMHYVSTHFMHPDDLLDEDRGAKEGWETYRKGLEDYLDWLEQSAPSIRMQTGTECAAAVQRFSGLTVSMATSDDSWDLHLGNLIDQGWLMFRANNGTPGRVRGGSLTKLTGNLYLLKATSATVHIERKTGGEA